MKQTQNVFFGKMESLLIQIHEKSNEHCKTRPKLLAIGIEASLNALVTKKFIFPADLWKNLQTALKEALTQGDRSHPEIEEKILLAKEWINLYFKELSVLTFLQKEVESTLNLLFVVYETKKSALRTSLIDSIFNEANLQLKHNDTVIYSHGVIQASSQVDTEEIEALTVCTAEELEEAELKEIRAAEALPALK